MSDTKTKKKIDFNSPDVQDEIERISSTERL